MPFVPQRMTKSGLTLIEVLASIAVAAIGVFGVLILLPLASRLSQIGFSNEAIRSNAENFKGKAEVFGLLDFNRWIVFNTTTASWVCEFPAYNPASPGSRPFPNSEATGWNSETAVQNMPTDRMAYCIDPMLTRTTATDGSSVFPSVFPYVANPTIGRYGSLNPDYDSTAGSFQVGIAPCFRYTLSRDKLDAVGAITPVGLGYAELAMSERNQITLASTGKELEPPQQVFVQRNIGGTYSKLRRETTGSKSSMALLLPTTSSSDSLIYRMVTLVLSNRSFRSTDFDRVFDVTVSPPAAGLVATDVDFGSGVIDVEFTEFDYLAGSQLQNLPSNGWVLLVPYDIDSVSGQRIVDWKGCTPYQILNCDNWSTDNDISATDRFVVSMVGPPYSEINRGTMAIYVPNCVDVRESEVRLSDTVKY